MTALTDHQAKLMALELLRRHPVGEAARIGSALMDAQVDLNPHQVDAALFAFRSPFSKGVILADEVGLGKTIEAGLVLTQRWAEGRRRVLVIAPANLRKQWVQELAEKFFLPAVILETKSFNAAAKAGASNPFEQPRDEPAVVVCSYQFAGADGQGNLVLFRGTLRSSMRRIGSVTCSSPAQRSRARSGQRCRTRQSSS